MVLGLLFMTGHASRLRCAVAARNLPALTGALQGRCLSPRHDRGTLPCMRQGWAPLLLHARGNDNACLAVMAPAWMLPSCRFDVSSWSLAFPLEALALGTLLYAAAIPGVLTNGAQQSQPAPAPPAATALGGGVALRA